MDLNFSAGALMAGFVFGVFGYYLYKEGRKGGNFLHVALGVVLMVYPYFFENVYLLWGIGVAICGLAYVKR